MRGLPTALKRKALAMPEAALIGAIVEAMVRQIAINNYCTSADAPATFNAIQEQSQYDQKYDSELAIGLAQMTKMLKEVSQRAVNQEAELLEIRKDIQQTERNVRSEYRQRASSRDRDRYGANFQNQQPPPQNNYYTPGYENNANNNNNPPT